MGDYLLFGRGGRRGAGADQSAARDRATAESGTDIVGNGLITRPQMDARSQSTDHRIAPTDRKSA